MYIFQSSAKSLGKEVNKAIITTNLPPQGKISINGIVFRTYTEGGEQVCQVFAQNGNLIAFHKSGNRVGEPGQQPEEKIVVIPEETPIEIFWQETFGGHPQYCGTLSYQGRSAG